MSAGFCQNEQPLRIIPMRILIGILFCLVLLPGCEPTVQPEDLGTIEHELPEIPGADEPYEMPELDEPIDRKPAEEKTDGRD